MSVSLFSLTHFSADDCLTIHAVRCVPVDDQLRLFDVAPELELTDELHDWIGRTIDSGRPGVLHTADGAQWSLVAAGPETISIAVPCGWDCIEGDDESDLAAERYATR